MSIALSPVHVPDAPGDKERGNAHVLQLRRAHDVMTGRLLCALALHERGTQIMLYFGVPNAYVLVDSAADGLSLALQVGSSLIWLSRYLQKVQG